MSAGSNKSWTRRGFLSASAATLAAAALPRPLSASVAHGLATPAGANTPAAPTRLSEGWEFYPGPLAGPWEVWHAEELAVFTPVTVPHSFNAYDGCDPDTSLYRGHGWYRTRVQLANPFERGRTLLHFLGSGQVTTLYLGETEVLKHEGGYDEWVADITDAAAAWLARASEAEKAKGLPVSVLCDNSRNLEIIPSDFSDFSLYGGLYRAVELVYVPAISIESLNLPTEVRLDRWAHVRVLARLYNPADVSSRASLRVKVVAPGGKLVQDFDHFSDRSAGEVPFGDFEVPSREFEFWSPAQPNLYRCEFTLTTEAGEHTIRLNFGIRHYEFVEHGPFMLNGERLLLRGTHRHEDHAGYANAMPDELIREELKLIKAMGANFIRLAHYQQNELVLALCDELGLLVWEELSWCRSGVGDEHWKRMSREKLTNMITQHRNHPSILLWGLGNEDDWPTEYPQPLDDAEKQDIRAWMTGLRDLAHRLDPSRLTSLRRCDFARDIPDVYSPSIWAGWYSGLYPEYEASLTKARDTVKRMIHIEYGADSLAGRHAEVPNAGLHLSTGQGTDERGLAYKNTGGPPRISRDGDWSETYACDLFDWHLKTQESLPWLTGAAQWIFKDFTTPLRPENPIPRINMKGLVTCDMTRKESYFVFQSYWAAEPMVHIYGHTWPVRWGTEGEQRTVKVYSNCDEVELFLVRNAKGRTTVQSLGIKRRNPQDFPAAGLRWSVPFHAGTMRFRAEARNGGKVVPSGGDQVVHPGEHYGLYDEVEFLYETRKWGSPAELRLRYLQAESETGSIVALLARLDSSSAPSAKALRTVEVQLYDSAGVPCLDARTRVRFSLAGAGRLLDNQGTPWGSREVELGNGRARIAVELTGPTAQVGITAKGLPPAYLLLKSGAP